MMDDESFLRRWSRRKTESRQGAEPAPEPDGVSAAAASGTVDIAASAFAAPADGPVPTAAAERARSLPTMDDVARLTSDSDFSAFVARGVDQAVRRTALKKLFADPHFNAMDGLDVYIDDYTKPSPVSEAMLATLEHAKGVLRRAIEEPDGRAPAQAGGGHDATAARTGASTDGAADATADAGGVAAAGSATGPGPLPHAAATPSPHTTNT